MYQPATLLSIHDEKKYDTHPLIGVFPLSVSMNGSPKIKVAWLFFDIVNTILLLLLLLS